MYVVFLFFFPFRSGLKDEDSEDEMVDRLTEDTCFCLLEYNHGDRDSVLVVHRAYQ